MVFLKAPFPAREWRFFFDFQYVPMRKPAAAAMEPFGRRSQLVPHFGASAPSPCSDAGRGRAGSWVSGGENREQIERGEYGQAGIQGELGEAASRGAVAPIDCLPAMPVGFPRERGALSRRHSQGRLLRRTSNRPAHASRKQPPRTTSMKALLSLYGIMYGTNYRSPGGKIFLPAGPRYLGTDLSWSFFPTRNALSTFIS